jgi:hypothetical protein
MSWNRSSYKNLKHQQGWKLHSNPPRSPFEKGDVYQNALNPSLEKRGRGDFHKELFNQLRLQDSRRRKKFSCRLLKKIQRRGAQSENDESGNLKADSVFSFHISSFPEYMGLFQQPAGN